jgi:hypothetical protein
MEVLPLAAWGAGERKLLREASILTNTCGRAGGCSHVLQPVWKNYIGCACLQVEWHKVALESVSKSLQSSCESFCRTQGVSTADFAKLFSKPVNRARLLEISLDGALADPELAEGAGSVRMSQLVRLDAQRETWSLCMVCQPFFPCKTSAGQYVHGEAWPAERQRLYRWKLLQSIKQHNDDPFSMAGVKPAGSGIARFRLNAEFAEANGLQSSGIWCTMQLYI